MIKTKHKCKWYWKGEISQMSPFGKIWYCKCGANKTEMGQTKQKKIKAVKMYAIIQNGKITIGRYFGAEMAIYKTKWHAKEYGTQTHNGIIPVLITPLPTKNKKK